MGTGHKPTSTRRATAASSPKSRSRPKHKRTATPAGAGQRSPAPGDVLFHLLETRSILACAARCLDEIADPHRLEAEQCGPQDVAVVVRAGIKRLDEARQTLDVPVAKSPLGTEGAA